MPGLTFSNQNQPRRPGGWIVPVVLIVISVVLVTVSARMGNEGVFASVRGAVHSISAPMQQVTSLISGPFKSIGATDASAGMSEDDVAALKEENQQLRTLLSQMEEYRQQNQRLTALYSLSDTYALQTVAGKVTTVSEGWDKTATLNIGSESGVQVGMGAMSSCGLYGQVESVTSNSCVVRLITDANSSVSAMVQGTRATGIVTGSYDGRLTMSYVDADTTVGEGDVIITSGEGGTYPQGIIIGTVSTVEKDSSKLYYNLTVNPIFDINSCEEVLILTGQEDSTASLVNQELLQSIIDSSASTGSTLDTTSTDDTANDGTAASGSDADGDTADEKDTAGSSAASGSSSSASSTDDSASTADESSDDGDSSGSSKKGN